MEAWERYPRKNILDKYVDNTDIEKTIVLRNETFYSESSGFGVYWCEDEDENCFTVKGTFISPLVVGQTYLVKGKIITYKREKQINVFTIKNARPINKKGIVAYLQSLRGLKSKAESIYDIYGEKSIEVLMDNPLDVARNIKGIGEKSVLKWQKQLLDMKDSQETMSNLLSFGLTINQAKKLYDKYGDKVVEKIQGNPYSLAREVKGYGFERCDRIAREISYNIKSPYRTQEGILFALEQASLSGHCFLPIDELIENSIDLLNIKLTISEMITLSKSKEKEIEYILGGQRYLISRNDIIENIKAYKKRDIRKKNTDNYRYTVVKFKREEIVSGIKVLSLQKVIVVEEDRVYLKHLYYAEQLVAYYIGEIIKNEKELNVNISEELSNYCKDRNIELEFMQKKAVLDFTKTSGGLCILNGSAGCGKTFTLNIILEMIERQFKKQDEKAKIMVLAPTGKASKVASKSTGRNCMTIHRGLKYSPMGGFEFNGRNKINVDVVVVDETSMLDIELAKNLFAAIPNGAKVILLGDTKQLPAVGAGNVLKDIIDSNKTKVITLNVVKRQGAESGIIRNANRIIEKKKIYSCEDTKDAYILTRETPREVQNTIIQSIKRIQVSMGYSLEDIQVLCPQKTGTIGTELLNYLLQQSFNPKDYPDKFLNKRIKIKASPDDREFTTLKLYFKKGDKVIHIKNNYNAPWMIKKCGEYIKTDEFGITNGECGVIDNITERINEDGEKEKILAVKYDDKYILYTKENINELEHAYALTIHKSQGSEWKAVIIPIMYQNYIMLDNSLFYTAYTRAEEFNVVIGQERAINHAIRTTKSRNRYTNLKNKIKGREQK